MVRIITTIRELKQYYTEYQQIKLVNSPLYGTDLGEGCRGCVPPPPSPEMTCGFLMQLVFCKIQSNLFNTDNKETELSVRFTEERLDCMQICILSSSYYVMA